MPFRITAKDIFHVLFLILACPFGGYITALTSPIKPEDFHLMWIFSGSVIFGISIACFVTAKMITGLFTEPTNKIPVR